MLEARINFLWSIAIRESKEIVKEKFIAYCEVYDNLEREPKVCEKIRHREMFEKYSKYIEDGE